MSVFISIWHIFRDFLIFNISASTRTNMIMILESYSFSHCLLLKCNIPIFMGVIWITIFKVWFEIVDYMSVDARHLTRLLIVPRMVEQDLSHEEFMSLSDETTFLFTNIYRHWFYFLNNSLIVFAWVLRMLQNRKID